MLPARDTNRTEDSQENRDLRFGGIREAEPPENFTFERDSTYREILGEVQWHKLKPEIRKRFSLRPGKGAIIRYRGTMHMVHLSFMGWLFAQICRLIGTPLAPRSGQDVPMEILLEPDEGGVAWVRIYKFPNQVEYTVRSTKKRGKNNDLIEHIGCGFSMALSLKVMHGDLFFISHAYKLKLLNFEIRIPDILTPGRTTVSHEQITGPRFRFRLSVDHPLFGRTIFQEGEFE